MGARLLGGNVFELHGKFDSRFNMASLFGKHALLRQMRPGGAFVGLGSSTSFDSFRVALRSTARARRVIELSAEEHAVVRRLNETAEDRAASKDMVETLRRTLQSSTAAKLPACAQWIRVPRFDVPPDGDDASAARITRTRPRTPTHGSVARPCPPLAGIDADRRAALWRRCQYDDAPLDSVDTSAARVTRSRQQRYRQLRCGVGPAA